MADQTILFSGLPDSGKTTFIAALWYFIFNSSSKDEYTFDTLEDSEQEYLNAISLSWASCEKVIRTNLNTPEEVSIRMRNNQTAERIILNIPDINGERFNRQFEFRQWEEDFEKILDDARGLVLFIDPRDQHNKPRLIYQENQLYRLFGDEKPLKPLQADQPWTEKMAPSQVKLVDFLQMLDYHRPGAIKKIAVIISCWDVLPNETDPKAWSKINVPLVYQYLSANDHLFNAKYFGISSQGGSYEKKESRLNLLKLEPLDRISVTDGTTITKNILSPILWLTNEN